MTNQIQSTHQKLRVEFLEISETEFSNYELRLHHPKVNQTLKIKSEEMFWLSFRITGWENSTLPELFFLPLLFDLANLF
jgi:hypothetical protein